MGQVAHLRCPVSVVKHSNLISPGLSSLVETGASSPRRLLMLLAQACTVELLCSPSAATTDVGDADARVLVVS